VEGLGGVGLGGHGLFWRVLGGVGGMGYVSGGAFETFGLNFGQSGRFLEGLFGCRGFALSTF
jgi:hypothetical protein